METIKFKMDLKIVLGCCMLMGLLMNACFVSAMTIPVYDEIANFSYTIGLRKYTTPHSTFYIEANQTISGFTKLANCSGYRGFTGCPPKYSGDYYYKTVGLGSIKWGNTFYYVVVYDGSNDNVSKYDRIAWSTKKFVTTQRPKSCR